MALGLEALLDWQKHLEVIPSVRHIGVDFAR